MRHTDEAVLFWGGFVVLKHKKTKNAVNRGGRVKFRRQGALNSVDKTTIYAGKVDGADWLNLFLRIELPQIAPDVCSITGSGIALNFKLMVAAEVLGATVTSLGTMFNMANYGFEVARTLALTIVVLILGLLVELLFNALSKKAGEWK